MALAPIYVPVTTTPPARFNLLDTIEVQTPTEATKHILFGGARFESEFCGIARPFTALCEDGPDLGTISVAVDIASVATITSTGLPDGTYRIVWGDGQETASEAEQLNETHDYTAAGDGDYLVQVYRNEGGVYAEVPITVTNGQISAPVEGTAVETKIVDDGLQYVVGDPITIYHLYGCRLVGVENVEAAAEERARRSLALGASRAVEEGFQTVIGTGAVDLSPATPVDPVKSLGILEQYAGENYGGRPVIHMDRLMATRLYEDGAIERNDGNLETGLGSLVVAGAGYNADAALPSAPGAGNDWMYVTGNVRIWASKPLVKPLVADTPFTNEFKSLAEQIYVPTYECFKAAIKVTE